MPNSTKSVAAAPTDSALLFEGPDWSFDKIQIVHDAINEIAVHELGLDPFPAVIEVISSEQMLDLYSSHGMPRMYSHWSFGKRRAKDGKYYEMGLSALAYEIVINSDPSICYVMEGNTMTMQTLVIAHAAFGHSHFFKNNELFKQWTDASGILDYLDFSKLYIAKCEEKYGEERVERILDAAHALWNQGINSYPRKPLNVKGEERRQTERVRHYYETYDDLWNTVPKYDTTSPKKIEKRVQEKLKQSMRLPEENVLYFLEKFAVKLEDWEREIIRIVRNHAQYFYPQMQTKVMNEGCATFVHYEIMSKLHERGQIDDGSFIEFLKSHTAVTFQPGFDDPRYQGMNPYALGFTMMMDIKRICLEPTAEDREWFPTFAGNQDPYGTLRDAWSNFRDESFIRQFLSPKVIRDFRFYAMNEDKTKPDIIVSAIHTERGYKKIRNTLANQYEPSALRPSIEIIDVNIAGDRTLTLHHHVSNKIRLEEKSLKSVLVHLADLWGYPVKLCAVENAVDAKGASIEKVLNTVDVVPPTRPHPPLRAAARFEIQ